MVASGDVAAVTPVLRPCHIPVTRRNGYGNVTGNNLVTRTRTRVTRTREPARVLKPVPITNDNLVTLEGRAGGQRRVNNFIKLFSVLV